MGICQTFRFVAEQRLKRGSLVEVLPHLQGRARPFSVLYALQRKRSAVAMALVDSLVNSNR